MPASGSKGAVVLNSSGEMKVEVENKGRAGNRLYSLDALRGFDMLLLLYGSTLAWSLSEVPWWPRWILTQFSHPWGVYTLFDVVQPLFAVVCGAAVPLALARRLENGRAGREYWRQVWGRFLLLLLLGAICSGLLTLDLQKAPYFGNTLQLLGFGYLFAATCYAYIPRRLWLMVAAALVILWGVALQCGGDMTPDGNLSAKIERLMTTGIVPGRKPGAITYTSWGTIPMFAALTILGAYMLGWMRNEALTAVRRANGVLVAGGGLIAVGVAVHFVQPEIKHIYTPAYTLVSAGVSLVLLGGFSWLFDILAVRRGTWLLTLYGRNALSAYMLWGLFGKHIQSAAAEILHGFEVFFVAEAYRPFVTMSGALFLSTALLWLWARKKKQVSSK